MAADISVDSEQYSSLQFENVWLLSWATLLSRNLLKQKYVKLNSNSCDSNRVLYLQDSEKLLIDEEAYT